VITFVDYGQDLDIMVGDIFTIEKALWDNKPITIGDTRILEHLTNTIDSRKETYKAIAAGITTLSTEQSFPCPQVPSGYEAPRLFRYVTVRVYQSHVD
jgi:hypothetical protein